MRLFFDTETTGVPRNYKAPASDIDNWPRMVQLAWLMMDERGEELASAEHVVRPDGFTIPRDAARIHGITTELALERGVDLGTVLDEFGARVTESSGLVAHNVSFDERVVGAEYLRAGRLNPIETKERLCTMKASTNLCALPGPYGYKWPTLTELHMHLFGEPFDGAHGALADVRACARCYKKLKRLDLMA